MNLTTVNTSVRDNFQSVFDMTFANTKIHSCRVELVANASLIWVNQSQKQANEKLGIIGTSSPTVLTPSLLRTSLSIISTTKPPASLYHRSIGSSTRAWHEDTLSWRFLAHQKIPYYSGHPPSAPHEVERPVSQGDSSDDVLTHQEATEDIKKQAVICHGMF